MNIARKGLFILAHQCGDTSFHSTYTHLVKNQWKSFEELRHGQEKQLRQMITFSFENVPYYRKLFKGLGLLPQDIRNIEDLEKLPILTKPIIKKHWKEFQPSNLSSMKYYHNATGGTTGNPLQFRLSKNDRFLGGAIHYRGWGYCGYELGDRMAFLAGSSFDIGTKPWLVKRAHEISRNLKKLSSFDMGENEMRDYVRTLNAFKPKFIRGYASSLYFFSDWIEENDLTIYSPSAVITTAEKIYPNMRTKISEVFNCEVIDEYGVNDGGISAHECLEHAGLHIDTERSILEVTDRDGLQIEVGQGQILATSLNNFAMPFIRYSTGDLATIKDNDCTCGRKYRLLDNIIGRDNELLITPAGRIVHGQALINFLFITLERSVFPGMVNRIKQFQIIQRIKGNLEISIVSDELLPDEVLEYVQKLIHDRFDGWMVEFRFVDSIDQTSAGKYKLIVNEMEPK